MDYEHLYSYFESRPLKEQKACMQRIVQLVRRQCNEDENLKLYQQLQLGSGESQNGNHLATMRRQEISEQFWTQQAVWYKFGDPNIEHTSFNMLTLATAPLFMKPTVAQYLVTRNALIDDIVAPKKDSSSSDHGDSTTASAKLAPPPLTVPAVHPNKHYTPHSTKETAQHKVHVEQNGDVLRPSKRGRESTGNRFDDKDLRAPHYHKPYQPLETHTKTGKPASQLRPMGQDTDLNKGEERSQNAKKPRRANFFD